ncbi:MAG: nitrate ABC transporter ATP-binding protein [Pseudomonadota bacterium]|nr:nitrate ABC transporter ATP-binding protein [Pseudomonadota bacterium]
MGTLSVRNLAKSYGEGKDKTNVLSNLNLEVQDGEFVAIVGFSGSGKTTLINSIAGLISPDQGSVLCDGKPIAGPGPDRGLVFQSYSLMPWLTVEGNVALAVDQTHKHCSRQERKARVHKYIDMVGLSPAKEKRPAELSGGMRQRVSVARALAANPDILLLDEPLSALDALTRANLQDEILRIWEEDRKTVILITNDVDEGLLMADRIIPLRPGPNATFGPEFVVDLPRPRDRSAMNHDPEFKALRHAITEYLIGVGMQDQNSGAGTDLKLPPVRPNTSNDFRLDTSALKPDSSDVGRARYLEFAKVSKVYPGPRGPITVVKEFDLIMPKGEFVSVIGHSGCGKSTVLSMTAGLTEISSGGIVLDNKEVRGAGPERAVVFQAPSLFPWMTAFENVALGVEEVYPHATRDERADICEYYLTRVGLGDALHKKAGDLSNGMKQRVGIARAFALSPKLLLLDEPFGMLDSLTRWELQEVLMEVWSRSRLTAMMVTHDVDEAILLADRVVMMTNGPEARVGKILEVDLPRPRSRKALLAHPDYYRLREELISFLAECDRH